MSDTDLKLQDARAAISRVFNDKRADLDELLEAFEVLQEDIEMYADRLERRTEREHVDEEEGEDGESDT